LKAQQIFKHYGVNEGLSQSSVYCIFQDKQGFLWVGTADGLNRFDGYSFRQINIKGPLSESQHYFWKNIIQDSEGNLWIGGLPGAFFYDYKKEELSRVHFPELDTLKDTKITVLGEDNNHEVWMLCASNYIIRYNLNKHSFSIKKPTENFNKPFSYFTYGTFLNDGILLLGTFNGLEIYDKDKNCLDSIKNYKESKGVINHIIPDGKDSYYITSDSGLFVYNSVTGKITRLISEYNHVKLVFDCAVKYENRIFLTTPNDGLYTYDIIQKKIITTYHHATDANSLSFDALQCLFLDKTNQLWIGSDGGGLNKMDLNQKFKLYRTGITNGMKFSADFSKCFYKDKHGRIWFGTHDKGLNIYDRDKDTTLIYNAAKHQIPGNIVGDIYKDSKNRIWIGTDLGICYTNDDLSAMHFVETYDKRPFVKGTPYVFHFYESKINDLLVATYQGLLRYDEKSKIFSSIDTFDNYALSIMERNDNKIWIGHYYSALLIYRNEIRDGENKFVIEKELPQFKNIRCMVEDKNHVWMASETGLIDYNPADGKTIVYNESNGLANRYIYGIIPHKNFLWLSTNKGISRFDKETKTFMNFTTEDGLQSMEFNTGAYYRADDGEFFFGGVNGFNSFYPDKIFINNYISTIQISSFSLSNHFLPVDSLTHTNQKITFNYNENIFDIDFSLLDYSASDKNTYFYSISQDSTWVSLGNRHHIHLSELAPGNYSLYVKAKNNDGIEIPKQLLISFTILPPLYKTWWFVLFTFIISISVISFIVWYVYIHKLKLRLSHIEREKEILQVRQRISRDMHDEIGSGLSRVSLLSQLSGSYSNNKEKLDENLLKIKNISQQLNGQLNEMIWSVNPLNDTLQSMLGYIRQYTGELLEENAINYLINFPEDVPEIKISPDFRRNLYSITKEVLNNALKYSGSTEIKIDFNYQENGMFSYSIADNGCGFDLNNIREFGNGIKNIKQRANESGVSINIDSIKGKGTIVKLSGTLETKITT
jgi:ligand-binding sensor domain-containing protein/two-component sensor histidine kinase